VTLARSAIPAALLASEVLREASMPFDLETGPLLRTRLLKLGDDDHVLLMTLHHCICDGWSVPILMREVAVLYGACLRRESSPLCALPVQVADYAAWQRKRRDASEAYWRNQLSGELPVLELPFAHAAPVRPTFRGAAVPIPISQKTAQGLPALARR